MNKLTNDKVKYIFIRTQTSLSGTRWLLEKMAGQKGERHTDVASWTRHFRLLLARRSHWHCSLHFSLLRSVTLKCGMAVY
jgi:hypothetical protein